MIALTVALFTAVLALIGNVAFALWREYRERRSIAAALAGEIGAYIELLDPPKTANAYRAIAALDTEMRRRRLGALPKTPTGHPVFDKLADKIGLLPAAEALEVSAIYNVVTGMRIVISGLSTAEFSGADDAMQKATLEYLADTMDRKNQPAQDLIRRLRRIADENPWQFLRSFIGWSTARAG